MKNKFKLMLNAGSKAILNTSLSCIVPCAPAAKSGLSMK